MGIVDEELVCEIYHTQPKMCHQTHVLFVLANPFVMLQCGIFEVLDHKHMTLSCFLD